MVEECFMLIKNNQYNDNVTILWNKLSLLYFEQPYRVQNKKRLPLRQPLCFRKIFPYFLLPAPKV